MGFLTNKQMNKSDRTLGGEDPDVTSVVGVENLKP